MLQEMRRTVRRRFRTRSYLLLALTSSQNYQKKSGAVYCFRSWPTKQLMCPTKKICLWFRFSPLRRRYLRRSNQATNLNAISDLGLSMDDCRGQSYDGAGNMAGRYVGASTLIQGAFKKALYVYCMNHRLNLCVADTCSLQMVKNMMGTVRKLSAFFSNSPKRQHHLVNKIKSLLPTSKHRVLIDVCRTRFLVLIVWIELLNYSLQF